MSALIIKPKRCGKGTRRNKKTGNCESVSKKSSIKKTLKTQNSSNKNSKNSKNKTITGKQRRCRKGTRRNKKTGNCDPNNGSIKKIVAIKEVSISPENIVINEVINEIVNKKSDDKIGPNLDYDSKYNLISNIDNEEDALLKLQSIFNKTPVNFPTPKEYNDDLNESGDYSIYGEFVKKVYKLIENKLDEISSESYHTDYKQFFDFTVAFTNWMVSQQLSGNWGPDVYKANQGRNKGNKGLGAMRVKIAPFKIEYDNEDPDFKRILVYINGEEFAFNAITEFSNSKNTYNISNRGAKKGMLTYKHK